VRQTESAQSLFACIVPQAAKSKSSPTDGVVYADNQFYVTHDAGQTWTSATPDQNFSETFVEMDFVDASTGWVITGDVNDHRTLYRTTDGGTSWSAVIP